MSLTAGTFSEVSKTTTGTTITAAHTVLASGANRVGMVSFGFNNNTGVEPQSVSSVSWDGNTVTKLGHDINCDDGRTELWYIQSDASVVDGDVVGTFNASQTSGNASAMGVNDFTDAGTPTGYVGEAKETSGSQMVSPTITSTSGDILYGCGTLEGGDVTAATGNTQEAQFNTFGTTEVISFCVVRKVSSGNGTVEIDCSADDHGCISAVNIPEDIALTDPVYDQSDFQIFDGALVD